LSGQPSANASAIDAVDYSVVVPVYLNRETLASTVAALRSEVFLRFPDVVGEVVFVNDGSGDGSFEELLRLQQANQESIRIVRLTRNFGQAGAVLAGLAHARGRCAAIVSADEQEPVDLVARMLTCFREGGHDIVICARRGRDESIYRVLTSRLFYWLIRRLSFPEMPPRGFDCMLLSRRAFELLLRHQEAYPFFQGQVLWSGFNTKIIEYGRRRRAVGRSQWTLARKTTYLIDGITAYSFLPIRLMSLMGVVVGLLGFLYAGVILMARLLWGNPVQGWAPLMIVILLLGGLQTFMLGVIGEYLWRTLAQVRGRPAYVVESIHEAAPRP